MNKLPVDILGIITVYLGNEDVQKLKPLISNRDFIYIDWLRLKHQESLIEKTSIKLENLSDYIIKKQLHIEKYINSVVAFIDERYKKYNIKTIVNKEVKQYFYKRFLLEVEDDNTYYIISDLLSNIAEFHYNNLLICTNIEITLEDVE